MAPTAQCASPAPGLYSCARRVCVGSPSVLSRAEGEGPRGAFPFSREGDRLCYLLPRDG